MTSDVCPDDWNSHSCSYEPEWYVVCNFPGSCAKNYQVAYCVFEFTTFDEALAHMMKLKFLLGDEFGSTDCTITRRTPNGQMYNRLGAKDCHPEPLHKYIESGKRFMEAYT